MADAGHYLPAAGPGDERRRAWLLRAGLALAAPAWMRSALAQAQAATPAQARAEEQGETAPRPAPVNTVGPSGALAGTYALPHEGDWVTVFPAPGGERMVLTIDGATDMALFAPVIRDFQRRHPDTTVRYADRQSVAIHARALRHARLGVRASQGVPYNPDLLISGSVDLQTRLANDGLALPYNRGQAQGLPAGAHWRHEVFCLGAEAVVMAYNPRLLPPARAPQTRAQLLALLRETGGPLRQRVGMYDATVSGLGYMLATQDARYDSTAGLLLASLGAAGVVLDGRMAALIGQLASGRLALLYNVPASYAQARIEAGDDLRIVYPQDYTLLTTRAAVIPATAGQPGLGQRFLDELLSPEGQAQLARQTRLLPIRQAVAASQDARALSDIVREAGSGAAPLQPGAWRPILPGLGLLVYLDPLKRQRFLDAWRAAVRPDLASISPYSRN